MLQGRARHEMSRLGAEPQGAIHESASLEANELRVQVTNGPMIYLASR